MYLYLPHRHLLGDLAFEAVAAKHTFGPSAVEGTSVGILEAGTNTAQPAELLITIRSHRYIFGKLGNLRDLTGQSLIRRRTVRNRTKSWQSVSDEREWPWYLLGENYRQSHRQPVRSQLSSVQALVRGSNLHLQQSELELGESWRSVCHPLVLPEGRLGFLADSCVAWRPEETGSFISIISIFL